MNLSLKRTEYRSDGIFGNIFLDTGELFCVTLEHSYLTKGSWLPKVPPGVYTCKLRRSPHFGYDVFELLNVPNCTFIEIHIGNFLNDSEGCILIGEAIHQEPSGTQSITNSRHTFANFMQLQLSNETFQLTVL